MHRRTTARCDTRQGTSAKVEDATRDVQDAGCHVGTSQEPIRQALRLRMNSDTDTDVFFSLNSRSTPTGRALIN